MSYDEAMAALRTAGIHPYVVNQKSPQHGYRRMWSIYVPAGPERDAQTIWADDNGRDQALQRLVRRYCTSE